MIRSANVVVAVMNRVESESAYDEDTHNATSAPEIRASRQPAGSRALERAGLTGEERAFTFFLEGAHNLDPNDQSLLVVGIINVSGAVTLIAGERYDLRSVEVWSEHTEVLAVRREVLAF